MAILVITIPCLFYLDLIHLTELFNQGLSWHEKDYEELVDVMGKGNSRQVICMTIMNYLYRSIDVNSCNQWFLSRGSTVQREVMILDEASQVWEMSGAFILNNMKGYKRFIIGGDHMQLDPYVSRDVDDAPSIMDWARKLMGKYVVPRTQLRRQYRMMPSVGAVVSKLFYNNNLVHNKVSDGERHLFFHNLEGTMDERGTSRYCVLESKRCLEIMRRYQGSNLTCQVLTFYEAQRQHMKSLDATVNVCCIDSYQGQEADVVFLLLSIRNCKVSKFMKNGGRICVAISRAKKDFHIAGNLRTMSQNTNWEKLLHLFK